MQVTSVNSTAASAISPQPAEDTARRADDFARVLQNAFYGTGSKAVANGAQQASQDSTPRTETRPVERAERPATERPVERSTERADRSDDTAKTETAPRDQAAKPAEKPAPKTEDKPAAPQDTAAKPVKDETVAETKPADAPKADGEAKTANAGKTAAEAGEELADAKDEAKPAVAVVDNAALILSLLQTQVPVAVAPAATPAVEGEVAAPVVAVSVATPVAAAPVVAPVAAAPVAAAPVAPVDATAAAAAPAAAAGQVAADAAVPQAGIDPAAQDAAAKAAAQALADAAAQAAAAQQQKPAADATQTSVAALLSQQQTMSKEDFAAIQQALAAQAQAQLQDDVKTVVAEPQQQAQLAQPQVAVAAPKSEGKPEKGSLTLEMQTVSAVVPKTLVDQSALMSMQGDDDLADAALLQQQAQAQAQQQPVGAEVKFAATLQSQLMGEAPVAVNTAAVQSSPAHIVQQQAAAVSAPAGQAAQASQHAASQQTLARNLNAYIPAGEQVAVQIKKGAAEGIDKISIRLDPGNLGNVEIKMEVGHDGRLMAVIAADKPETLQMLQKDAASLEQSLRDAGLKTDQQSLSFSLRDQNQAQAGREGRDGAGYGRQRGRGTDEYAETSRIDPAQAAAAQAQRAAAARGGLDIKI